MMYRIFVDVYTFAVYCYEYIIQQSYYDVVMLHYITDTTEFLELRLTYTH